jgi:NADH-quinone oxidoreductase subunit N
MSPAPPLLSLSYAALDFASLLPEIVLVLGGCAALMLGAGRGARASASAWTALLSVILALLIVKLPLLLGQATPSDIGGGLLLDSVAEFARTSGLILGIMLVLAAWYQPSSDERGEFFAMLLFALAGLLLVGAASDLVVLFMAIELVSIPTYAMVTLSRRRLATLEAGTKYFYLGALAAAVTAYGFSFLYGVSGTAEIGPTIHAVSRALADQTPEGALAHNLAVIGVVLSIGGLLFKISAVPLHFYVADVYQGAASPVAGFLGFVPKLAGFIAIVKVVDLAGWQNTTEGGLFWLIFFVSALSMTVGNLLALRQTNVKRMLAYSGVAHSGYMLVGLVAGPTGGVAGEAAGMMSDGTAALFYYAVVYGIANLGAFALLALLRLNGRSCETLRDLAGLLRRSPLSALLMALAMFTLMGLPPTPGFWGKLTLFGSALGAGQAQTLPLYQNAIFTLVVVAVLNSALAAAYYLRVIAAVLLHESDEPAEAAPREALQMGAVLCGLLLLIFTLLPDRLLQVGRFASRDLRSAAVELRATAPGDAPAATLVVDAPRPSPG